MVFSAFYFAIKYLFLESVLLRRTLFLRFLGCIGEQLLMASTSFIGVHNLLTRNLVIKALKVFQEANKGLRNAIHVYLPY